MFPNLARLVVTRGAALALLALLAAAPAASAHASEEESGPRLSIERADAVHPGDWLEFSFEGDIEGIAEFEVLLSTDGGRTYPLRISEELEPGTRRWRWQVPALECGELRLRVQFNRDGREIEGEESAVLPLIHGGPAGATIPIAVEVDPPRAPVRDRGDSRPSSSDRGLEDDSDLDPLHRPSSGPAPFTAIPGSPSHRAPNADESSATGAAPRFVPPRR